MVSNGYAELNETNDDENHPEENYRLRRQLEDRQNQITLLTTQVNQLESSNRRKKADDQNEEAKEEEEEEKVEGDDINEYLLSDKQK